MRTLFTLLLTALTATSGLAGSGSQEEGASLTWTGGHTAGKVTVVIDGYTHNSILTSGDSVPLGTQIILVCRVVGLPYGIPLNYTWTCQNGDCVPKVAEGSITYNYGKKIYNDSILAVNTTYTYYGGTYTCRVMARGQEATGSFNLNITGGSVVHSYGRLIPHELPITDLQQISGPDGIGRITCTVSSGTARFAADGGQLETGGVAQTRHGATAALVVNPSNVSSFNNRGLHCNNFDHFFYLFLSSKHPQLKVPQLTLNQVRNTTVEYQTQRNDNITIPLIAGYQVTRFGVPMIGQYVNTGRGRRVTISPAVPGAQYRITAWALGDGRRSATPAVVDATTGEAKPSPPRNVTITRVFQDGVELNWLPPTEPNGEVHYVVGYKREDSGNWTSVNTTSDSTHYNLTGLHSGTNYVIRVVVVNSVGRLTTTTPSTFSNFVKSSSRIMEPTSSTVKPTSSTVKPTSSTVKPTSSTVKPTSSKPTSSTIKPTSSKAASSTIKPTSSKPALCTSTIKITLCTAEPTSNNSQGRYNVDRTGTTGDHGKEDIAGIIVSVTVASLLLTVLGLTAGIIIGVVLGRRMQTRNDIAHKRQCECQERSGTANEMEGATEEEGAKFHTYDVVGDDTSIDGRAGLYQGLDVGTLDYVSEYTQLKGGTYQELDLKGREEEHLYQRAHTNREREQSTVV